jgi:hypothetical protein
MNPQDIKDLVRILDTRHEHILAYVTTEATFGELAEAVAMRFSQLPNDEAYCQWIDEVATRIDELREARKKT